MPHPQACASISTPLPLSPRAAFPIAAPASVSPRPPRHPRSSHTGLGRQAQRRQTATAEPSLRYRQLQAWFAWPRSYSPCRASLGDCTLPAFARPMLPPRLAAVCSLRP
eukprot:585092-Prymnesium_polylepis.3